MPGLSDAGWINLVWLVRLRWGALAGQVATIFVARHLLGADLPMGALLTLVGVGLASNVACALWARHPRAVGDGVIGIIMALDVLLLTGLLYLSGGPFNPFSFLYLVHIALAAAVLPARYTWALAGLSLVCSGLLFVDHEPLLLAGSHGEHMDIHLRGMWVALGVAAGFIVYFLLRVRRALAERETEAAEVRELAARQARLASLATLAAGAAHELATPLGTIAVATKELERHLAAHVSSAETLDDVRLIRAEVDRCRAILDRMAAEAGESAGEAFVPVALSDVVSASVAELAGRVAVRVTFEDGVGAESLRVPRRALVQALRGVLQNAEDASPEGAEVVLHAARERGALRVEVRDEGAGMAPEVLARAGEPFFTTKPAGRGMGLGLLLTRAVIERLGGSLALESFQGKGTTVRILLPHAARAAKADTAS